MFRKYYMSYGSNLNSEIILDNCPSAKLIGTSILKDYRLAFKGSHNDYAYLTIEECTGSLVPVGIYSISICDIRSLDMFECYPSLYTKKIINVKVNDKYFDPFIYIMKNGFDYHYPSSQYYGICQKGYEEFGFDQKYLEQALEYTDEKIKRKTL